MLYKKQVKRICYQMSMYIVTAIVLQLYKSKKSVRTEEMQFCKTVWKNLLVLPKMIKQRLGIPVN